MQFGDALNLLNLTLATENGGAFAAVNFYS